MDVDPVRVGDGRLVLLGRDGVPCAQVPYVLMKGMAAVVGISYHPDEHLEPGFTSSSVKQLSSNPEEGEQDKTDKAGNKYGNGEHMP